MIQYLISTHKILKNKDSEKLYFFTNKKLQYKQSRISKIIEEMPIEKNQNLFRRWGYDLVDLIWFKI